MVKVIIECPPFSATSNKGFANEKGKTPQANIDGKAIFVVVSPIVLGIDSRILCVFNEE